MTSWTDYQDDISDAISDSMDVDWSASVGARAVVAWLNEHKPLSTTPRLKAIRDKFLMPTPDKDFTDYAIMTRCVEALSAAPAPGGAVRYRHKKRGTEYTLIGVGRAQGELQDEDPVVLYRGDDGGLWVRHQVEFCDGRFEQVSALAAHSDDKPEGGAVKGPGDYTMALATHQAFERFPALASHIEGMAIGSSVGALIEWDAFLRELNAALATREEAPA